MIRCPFCGHLNRPTDAGPSKFCEECLQPFLRLDVSRTKSGFREQIARHPVRYILTSVSLIGILILVLTCRIIPTGSVLIPTTPVAVAQRDVGQPAVQPPAMPSPLTTVEPTGGVAPTITIAPVYTAEPTTMPPPTFTPEPTATPVPTVTPIPDNGAGDVLQIGQTWRQNGVEITVMFARKDYICPAYNGPWHVWGEWQVIIKNTAKEAVTAELNEAVFFLRDEDNVEDTPYVVAEKGGGRSYSGCYRNDLAIHRHGVLDLQILNPDEQVKLKVYGRGDLGERRAFTFGMTKIGDRVTNAMWYVEIK